MEELKAKELSEVLKPQVEEVKGITIKMFPGKRPEVVFSGTWTGKYIRAAMDSIAKAYRLTRRRVAPPTLKVEEVKTQVKPEGGK